MRDHDRCAAAGAAIAATTVIAVLLWPAAVIAGANAGAAIADWAMRFVRIEGES